MTPSDLLTVAVLIIGFGTTVLLFRVQREIEMHAQGEVTWIPFADRLLFAALVFSCVVLIGLLMERMGLRTAQAILATSTVLLLGYIPTLLAHYRLILDYGRTGPRENPEPGEQLLFITTVLAALAMAGFFTFQRFFSS